MTVAMHSKASGFTLIEILLAMSILSLVLLTGTYSYNFMQQNWQRNQTLYMESMADYRAWLLVTNSVSNTLPKLVRDGDSLSFYFLGREEGFTGFTYSSVQQPDVPAVYRLFRESAMAGTWQLVYEEALLLEQQLISPNQTLPFNYRVVLADNLPELWFEYFGWENRQALNESLAAEFSTQLIEPQWFTDYDGFVREMHPLVLQVNMGDFIWPIEVPDLTGELIQMSSDQSL